LKGQHDIGNTKQVSRLVWVGAVLVIAFAGIQFVRPELTNPPVTADLQAPPEVKQVLRNRMGMNLCFRAGEMMFLWAQR